MSYLMLPSSSPFNGPLRGPVDLCLEGTSSLRTIRVRNCPRPVRYSRLGPTLSGSRHGHGLDDDQTRTESTDSLMKGSHKMYSSQRYLWTSDCRHSDHEPCLNTFDFRIEQLWRNILFPCKGVWVNKAKCRDSIGGAGRKLDSIRVNGYACLS